MRDDRVEQVHRLFRGAAETVKVVRGLGLILDLLAAGILIQVLFVPTSGLVPWQPLIALLLLVGSQALLAFAENSSRFAERCRRLSARAFGLGVEIPRQVLATLVNRAPLTAERLAQRLPSTSVDEYYSTGSPPGEERLREIYCHSAFYTSRLLRRLAQLQFLLAVALITATFMVMYWLIVQPPAPETSGRVLEALCSVVFAVLGLRALQAGTTAASSAEEARHVAVALLSTPPPTGLELEGLVEDYDFSRTCSTAIPTWLYRSMRDSISSEWQALRETS